MREAIMYFITADEGAAAKYCPHQVFYSYSDRVKSITPLENSGRQEVLALLDLLSECGADTGTAIYIEEEVPNDTYFFTITSEVKQQYFRERWKAAHQAVEELQLGEFATVRTERLLSLLDDRYGNASYSSERGFCTMDDFIRSANIGATYYVASAAKFLYAD